jgi:4a-hydroxytetrahydrobiopterin dehydratase
MSLLTEQEVVNRLKDLPGWERQGNAITRQYTLGSFPEAIAFIVRLAFDAEAADHHPDILVNYKRVRLTWSTHSAGGLTEKDFAGARTADRLAGTGG